MAKATDVRPKITLACVECKERNYITRKNRRNDRRFKSGHRYFPGSPLCVSGARAATLDCRTGFS